MRLRKEIHQSSNMKNLFFLFFFSFIPFIAILEKYVNANCFINPNIHIYDTLVHVLKALWVICILNSSNFLGKSHSRTDVLKYCNIFRVVYFWMQGFISIPKENTFFAVVLLSLYLLLCWISLRLTLNFLLQYTAKFLMKMPNCFPFMLGKKTLWKYWIVLVWKCISFYYKTWGNKQS